MAAGDGREFFFARALLRESLLEFNGWDSEFLCFHVCLFLSLCWLDGVERERQRGVDINRGARGEGRGAWGGRVGRCGGGGVMYKELK